MKKRNKIIIAASLILACGTLSLFAKDDKPAAMPKRNEVVIISRAVVSSTIDLDSRKQGFGIKEGSDNDIKEIPMHLEISGSGFSTTMHRADNIGKPTFSVAKVDPKTGKIRIKSFKCFMFGKYPFYLPVVADVVVPEGEQFVYIGSFEYKLDYALRITNARRFDEYNEAVKWAKEKFAKDNIEVIRGELVPVENEER